MAVREDLITSAVSFLQDPSVANAPLDKRIEFLRSKNLTQEEIDVSLGRAGEAPPSTQPTTNNNFQQPQQQLISRGNSSYNYGPYPGYWQQPPPPEVPRRDWRDYFIMATVMSGLSYGVYFLAKRYIVPLVAPPTPPQLEQDKASIDESFKRAFDLIDQLSQDTSAIKASEDSRKEKLDSALSDMERAVEEMKISQRRRDDDSRRINDEIRNLHSMIPKAMKVQEENTDNRLRELNTELKSLKTLISNRMSGAGVAGAAVQRPSPGINGTNMFGPQGTASVNGSATKDTADIQTSNGSSASEPTSATSTERPNTASAFNRFGTKGGIPAWQMAASKKEDKKESDENQNAMPSTTG